jgi:iron complex outermembrane receptor protein
MIVRAILSRGTTQSWEAGASGSFQMEEFEDQTAPPAPTDRYRNGVLAGWLQWQSVFDRTLTVGIGLEATASNLDGRAFPSGTSRQGGAFLTSLRWKASESGLTVLPMVRWDVFSDIGPQPSPRVAVEWPVREDGSVVLRASAGSGFRMPNFNELYWRPGGNPSLRPERAVTLDGGIELRALWLGEHRITAGVFHADTRDRITGWPPSNVARTSTRGVEGTWTWSSSVHRLWATGTFASVESREPLLTGRQAPYVPRLVGAGGVDVLLGSVTISPGFRYVSRRYTTSDNSAALSVAPSVRAALHLKTSVSFWGTEVGLQGGVENVFNAAEESLPGYPLPGRSYTVRLSLDLAP